MTRYGLPYKGSKNKIARQIVEQLPAGDCFVDLFAGGGAVTHAAMLSGKWKQFIMNDVHPGLTRTFKEIASGHVDHQDYYRMISRQDFKALPQEDWLHRLVWSFGNGARTYLWGEDTEQVKQEAHMMLACDTIEERYRHYLRFVALIGNAGDLQNEESIQRLVSLERLQSLQSLQSLQMDYHEVRIPDGAIVYCDIPYRSSTNDTYVIGFDWEAFYDFARRTPNCYISETWMPDDFEIVWEKEKPENASWKVHGRKRIERLYRYKG